MPRWVALLAVVLEDITPDALLLMLGDTQFTCYQVLGVPYSADVTATRQAMRELALLYHPDKGGQPEQMVVVNETYAECRELLVRENPLSTAGSGSGKRASSG